MGNLFSRAIKRFTQCRNQLPSQEEQQQQQETATNRGQEQQQGHQESRPTVQSIPVGQSIDSAEYVALDLAKNSKATDKSLNDQLSKSVIEQDPARQVIKTKTTTTTTIKEEVEEDEDEEEEAERQDENVAPANEMVIGQEENNINNGGQLIGGEQNNTPAVEEAVIKIQALVRGHLTRKALKDAHQQAATPAPNALGQSQFDEESLISNPPSAVFSCPLNAAANLGISDPLETIDQLTTGKASGHQVTNSRVPPLESIAEGVEGTPLQQDAQLHQSLELEPEVNIPQELLDPITVASASSNDGPPEQERRRASPISRSLAISRSGESQADSISPAPSEANASIDLTCDTPASASIDIMDHNIRPGDTIATVLHHHRQPQPQNEQNRNTSQQESLTNNQEEAPRMLIEPPPPQAEAGAPSSCSSSSSSSSAAAVNEPLEANDRVLNGENNKRATNFATSNSMSPGGLQNSHSIDSAEAAAIRIQSAFRGYHTRKHSPYRRRSPGGRAISTDSSPQLAMGPLSLDSGLSNGNGGGGGGGGEARRSSLRQQQNATVALDDLVDEIEAAIMLDEEEQRAIELDSDDIERRDPSGQSSLRSPPIEISGESTAMGALVSGGNSFEEEPEVGQTPQEAGDSRRHSIEVFEEEEEEQDESSQNNLQRLGIESPDEAIGSGRSSPALISSNGASGGESSDEEAADASSEQVERPDDGQPQGDEDQQAQEANSGSSNGASGPSGSSKSQKKNKNRNRKKGRK